MNSLEKVLKGGKLTITEDMFHEVADAIGHFTKEQIMKADLPMDLLLEIANGGWSDTCQMEQIMNHLANKYLDMPWPCYSDSASVQYVFKMRLKEFKEK